MKEKMKQKIGNTEEAYGRVPVPMCFSHPEVLATHILWVEEKSYPMCGQCTLKAEKQKTAIIRKV